VTQKLIRLFILVAIMLLPLGMSHPGAAAQARSMPAMTEMAGTTMPDQHCPNGDPQHGSKAMPGDCTMACASALPAADPPQPLLNRATSLRVNVPHFDRLIGVLPEIATPPPRRA
jgi:hypothetical protein